MRTGPVAELTYAWDDRDVILYALGVGARLPGDLALLYESAQGFRTAPTFALAPMTLLLPPLVAALGIDLRALLHAGQELEIVRPMPVAGRARVTREVVEVVDKGRAALVMCEDAVEDDAGPLARGRSTWWVAGAGGGAKPGPPASGGRGPEAKPPQEAGGAKAAPSAVAKPPARDPDWRAVISTTAEQAALHRLSGDRNPVHIDPGLARAAGQPGPFLHGLATFGVLALAIEREGHHLDRLSARFTRPVFPGDALTLEAWWDAAVARVSVAGDTVLIATLAAA